MWDTETLQIVETKSSEQKWTITNKKRLTLIKNNINRQKWRKHKKKNYIN